MCLVTPQQETPAATVPRLWDSLDVALGWLWCSLRVALGWLCTPESMPSICLVYGFEVALGGFARPFCTLHSAFCIFPSVALGGFYRMPG